MYGIRGYLNSGDVGNVGWNICPQFSCFRRNRENNRHAQNSSHGGQQLSQTVTISTTRTVPPIAPDTNEEPLNVTNVRVEDSITHRAGSLRDDLGRLIRTQLADLVNEVGEIGRLEFVLKEIIVKSYAPWMETVWDVNEELSYAHTLLSSRMAR